MVKGVVKGGVVKGGVMKGCGLVKGLGYSEEGGECGEGDGLHPLHCN